MTLQWCKPGMSYLFFALSSLLSLSLFSVWDRVYSKQRERGKRAEKDRWEEKKSKNKVKKEKRLERDWLRLLRWFSLLLFLSCELSVFVCVCISIFKPLHRGWLLYSLPISPTDCTLGNFLYVRVPMHVYVFHCYRGGNHVLVCVLENTQTFMKACRNVLIPGYFWYLCSHFKLNMLC